MPWEPFHEETVDPADRGDLDPAPPQEVPPEDYDEDWRCECGDLNRARAYETFCYRCGAGRPLGGEASERRDALAWHREHYGVPARRGVRVTVDGRSGTIVGARDSHLRVRFDEPLSPSAASGRRSRIFSCHPTWLVDYGDGRDYGAEHDERVEAFVAALSRREAPDA